jgi:TPP-dependent pyruvate/acetoin dehydrogenase alpha subunit
MVTMRHFENALQELSQSGQLRGSLHLATGQEALPAGACAALRKTDNITMTYRGHGYVLAKGCNLGKVTAEIMGRSGGMCQGKGGKMHIFDPENGVLGANGIVAGGIPTAVGAAFSSKLLKEDRIALTVFGDGAVNQGVAHEVFNMASLWKLPIIFLCENNLYAEMTPLDRSSAVTQVSDRMAAYGIPAIKIDGNDVLEVYDAVATAASNARKGSGPTFIEAMTYRTCGHYHLDPGFGYRTKEEVDEWEANSPIKRFGDWLTKSKKGSAKDLAELEDLAKSDIDKAVKFALASPIPDDSIALEGVFV